MISNVVETGPLFSLSFVYGGFSCVGFDVPVTRAMLSLKNLLLFLKAVHPFTINEPPRGKTNNVVSEQVRHKPTCASTEKS